MDRLDLIKQACQWVESKGSNTRDGCKVTTRVKWANWDRKEFSPAMCVLWWGEVHDKSADGYDTFWIPQPDTWIDRVSTQLHATPDWVRAFIEQCHTGFVRPERYSANITFDVIEGQHKNPRIEWKHECADTSTLLPEAVYCLEKYGTPKDVKNVVPYYTKDPPIDQYRSKMIRTVYDLFEALQATNQLPVQE